MKKLFFAFTLLSVSVWAVAQSSIKFVEQKHDFGIIKEDGGKVTYVFGFTNEGDEDLVIQNVKTPCGCTSPKWTQSAIPPGKGGYVEATYDPMHRPGAFSKVLTVVTNGTPLTAYLTIVGEVVPRKRTVEDKFPMVKGNIRYQMPQVYMGKIQIGTVDTMHIRFYNKSDKNIKITRVSAPAHIKAQLLKPDMSPKGYGKIVLSYDASKRGELGSVNDQIIVYTDDDADGILLYIIADIEQYLRPLTPAEMANAPRIAAKDEVIDLGQVTAGKELTGKFELMNNGKDDLHITRVQPECGCTSTTITGETVKSGESTTVNLKFDSSGYDGLIFKTIDIYSNDPTKPKYTLKMKVLVVPAN